MWPFSSACPSWPLYCAVWGIHSGYDGFSGFGAPLLYLNGLSITAGYHRLWAHGLRSPGTLALVFCLWGAGALQNSILVWASDHRRHHRHVDDRDRPLCCDQGAGSTTWLDAEALQTNTEDFSNARFTA